MKKLFFVFYFLVTIFCLVNAQSNDWLWASQGKYGYSSVGQSQDILATDYSANCFLTGVLYGEDSLQFGSYSLKNNDNPNDFDIYLVKFDDNGNVVWAKQSVEKGNAGPGNGYVVSTDGMGNAYIVANFTDTLLFDSYMLKTQPEDTAIQGYYIDNFIVKYDANGNVKWAKQSQIPSLTSTVEGISLATEWNGNSYITGLFSDTVYFGAKSVISIITNDTSTYTFLTKYDANGNVKWAVQSTGHSRYGSEGICVAVNNSDGVFVAGAFADSVTFGSYKLNAPLSIGDVFVIKYDTNGKVKWARQGVIPSSHNVALPHGITTDNFGNVYVAGSFWDTVVFGVDTLTATTNYNTFIVKYDANGNVKWAKSAHQLDNTPLVTSALACDNKADIFMAGAGQAVGASTFCFGNDTLSINDTATGDTPSFVVKYDSSGNVLCSTIIPCAGGGNTTTWSGIASDTSGQYVYFGGTAFTVGIFGGDTVNPFEYPSSWLSIPFIARWNECDLTLGINNIMANDEFNVKLYPNPSNGMFIFQSSVVSGKLLVEVYNVLGEQVYSSLLPQTPKGALNEINLSSQPNGVYLYRVMDNNGSLIGQGKLVIQK